MKTVELKKFGVELRSRESAQKIRENLDFSEKIAFDLQDVILMTPSFCDELFGLLFFEKGEKFFRENVQITNVDEDIKPIIKRTLQLRKEFIKAS